MYSTLEIKNQRAIARKLNLLRKEAEKKFLKDPSVENRRTFSHACEVWSREYRTLAYKISYNEARETDDLINQRCTPQYFDES